MKNCASRQMKHCHSLCFLSVRGSIPIFQIEGLGFEQQQNGLRIVHVILLCADDQRQNLLIKTKNT